VYILRTQRLETGFDNHQTVTLEVPAIAASLDTVAKLKQNFHQDCIAKLELASVATAF